MTKNQPRALAIFTTPFIAVGASTAVSVSKTVLIVYHHNLQINAPILSEYHYYYYMYLSQLNGQTETCMKGLRRGGGGGGGDD